MSLSSDAISPRSQCQPEQTPEPVSPRATKASPKKSSWFMRKVQRSSKRNNTAASDSHLLAIVPTQPASEVQTNVNMRESVVIQEAEFCIGDEVHKTYHKTSNRGVGRVVGVEVDLSGKTDTRIKVQWNVPKWMFWRRAVKKYDPAKLARIIGEEQVEQVLALGNGAVTQQQTVMIKDDQRIEDVVNDCAQQE